MTPEYDVVIVGAGTSGCALAARLSERPGRSVLLLEAGPLYRSLDEFPPELAMASSLEALLPGHPNNWSFVGELAPGRPFPMPRGKVVGGSSAINGTVVLRAREADFEEWALRGGPAWSPGAVLPYQRRLESDLDFPDAAHHGSSGPVPVSRPARHELHPVSAAFLQACGETGFPLEADKNGPGPAGVGLVPHNTVDGRRINAAAAYLTPALDRPNLLVRAGCRVSGVVIESARAVGVRYRHRGDDVVVGAGEVVLCAGALVTPQLLLLSGVGPADALARHGIGVVCDLPGVGRGAKDHPSVSVGYRLDDATTSAIAGIPPPWRGGIEAALHHQAAGSDMAEDLQITCYPVPTNTALLRSARTGGRRRLPPYLRHPLATVRGLSRLGVSTVATQARAGQVLALNCGLEQERSSGSVELSSADPEAAPRIALHYLSDPDDLPRLRANVRTAADILRAPALRAMGAVRIAPGDDVVDDDDRLDRWIEANLASAFHTACTTRMGTDPLAVVDQRCRVHGVEGLAVVDVSVMPSQVRRPPYATALLIGERASEFFD